MRPIDADALAENLTDKAKGMAKIAESSCGQAADYYSGIKTGFTNAAIVADSFPTIEPMRCGECIHYNAETCLCYYHNMRCTAEWFCADGEKLEKENDWRWMT